MSGPFDPSPLDKVTLDKTSVDTSASVISTTADENPRFQFSRELKILLGVLALGAAVAGWYVLSGAGTPADMATATIPPATTTPAQSGQAVGTGQTTTGPAGAGQAGTGQAAPVSPGTEVVPGVTAGTGSAAGSSGTGSAQAPSVTGGTSGGPVNVPVVPPLNPQGSQGQNPAGGATGTPAGINPEDPLAAVPTSNPFQPLTVVNTNAAVGTGAPQVASVAGSSTAAQAGSRPNNGSGSSGSAMPVAGAVPLPNVPIAGVGGNSGGANLTGANTKGTGSSGPGSLGSGGPVPLPTIAIGGLPSRGTSTGTVPPPTGTVPPPAAPVLPAAGTITPGLSTPNLSSLPLGTLAAGTGPGTAGTGTSGGGAAGSGTPGAGTPGTGAGAVGDPSALTATSVQPGLISQYGSANAPAVPVVSALDQLVQSRNLVFNAVVLGPINTAIFKTAQGFVVVPTGQNLPDSTVTLKEVTATSATLSLGDDSKILELDKR
ncbi:hypothetical protein Q0M94_09455 [Deinococcus radiomollis]|uniref:hypothetical protein n=1 Tax=Deinococcus radiomollis TaxID=468916 RepID=UPI00389217AE